MSRSHFPQARSHFRFFISALAGSAALLLAVSAQGQRDYTWNGDIADWNNAGLWSPAGGPPRPTDNVIWNAGAGNASMVNRTTITMNDFTLNGGSQFTQIANSGISFGPVSFIVNGNMTHTGTGSSVLFRGSTRENNTLETMSVTIAGNLSTSGGQAIDFGQHRTEAAPAGPPHFRSAYALAGLTVGGTTSIGSGGQIRIYTNGATATFGEVNFATTGSNMRFLLSEGSFTSDHGALFPPTRTVAVAGLSGGINSAASRVAVSSSSTVEGGAVILRLTGSGTYNYAGQIVNRGDATVGVSSIAIEKTGSGVQIFSGTGVWAGTTTVRAGGLIIDGTHTARGNGYTIHSGAWFGGDGRLTLAGADLGNATLLFERGAKFVFDSGKTLTVDNSAFNIWTVNLANLTVNDLVNRDGSAIVWSAIPEGTYTLIDGNATFTGINTDVVNNIGGSGMSARFLAGSGLRLQVSRGSTR